MARQTGIRAELVELHELGAGRRLGHDQALAHVEVPAELAQVAGPWARHTPGHKVVARVAVRHEIVTILVVAVDHLLRGHPLVVMVVLLLLLPAARQ